MNITKYYIPDWKKKKNGNLSSVFYVFEGTEEKFNKTVHKISFLFTILAYLAMSFYLHSFIEASQDIQAYVVPILFPMGSVLIIIFLRKFFLHTQNPDLLNIISIILITISVVFFIVFQYFIFKDKKPFEIFGFSFIGGVCFGMFSKFLKYYSNIYGQNFRLTTILGYIGIFTIITIPFILCAICLFDTNLDEHFNLFSQGNSIAIYIILFITSFAKFYCCFHCIISLSPLVFSILLFFSLFLNNLINIFWGYIKSGWAFYVAGVFLILGVSGGILDKYLKNTLKAQKREDDLEIEERTNKQNNNDTFDDSYVK
jgi:predicted tellurium resistance membrane protein TerC